jgi:hypothetical protein
MFTITPCPQCGSRTIEISVTIEAIQRITLHSPSAALPEAYSSTIQHEDVAFKDIRSACCVACTHAWGIEPTEEMVTCRHCDRATPKASAGPNKAGDSWIGACCWDAYWEVVREGDEPAD